MEDKFKYNRKLEEKRCKTTCMKFAQQIGVSRSRYSHIKNNLTEVKETSYNKYLRTKKSKGMKEYEVLFIENQQMLDECIKIIGDFDILKKDYKIYRWLQLNTTNNKYILSVRDNSDIEITFEEFTTRFK